MHKLPPLPKAVRVLRADESERLDSIYNDLPKSLNDCVTCFGKKSFLWYEEYGVEGTPVVEYECPCVDQFVLFKFFLNAGMGRQFQRFMIGDCTDVDKSALDAIDAYTAKSDYYVSRGTGLLFHGTHGSGKTLLSVLLLKILLSQGFDGYFTTFNMLLDSFTGSWRNDEQKVWFEKRIRNVTLLVVDDIGKENQAMNAVASNTLDTVFRSRVQNSLPTIITTNMTPSKFESTYSSGTMGLVTETSLAYEFTGETFRNKVKQRTEEEIRLMLSRPITVS